MDYTQLKRDKSKVLAALKTMPDNSVVAVTPLEVHFPKRFVDRSFATIGTYVESIMMLGIVLPSGHFESIMREAEVRLAPTNIRETMIAGITYVVLEFEAGDTVFQNLTVVKDEHLNNPYYTEFTFLGRIPWYVPEINMPKLFDQAGKTTGRRVGSSNPVFRILYALAFRDPDNLEQAYRYSMAMAQGRPPKVVGLNTNSLLIDGTFNRLMSGYLNNNINGAILKPDTRVTDSEKVMKGVPD